MLHQNQRIVDNPIYLCDLGASLSAGEPAELQKILEETDVIENVIASSKMHFMKLYLIYRSQNACSWR